MEQRISVISLGVAEVARSLSFYEGLGWQSQSSSDEITLFQAGA